MTRENDKALRLVVIGDATWEKPFEATCGACRSPYGTDIDQVIAEGYSYRQVRSLFAGRRPACPNETILRAHVSHGHLASPHLKARLAFEEAAAARGDDPGSVSAGAEDAIGAVLRHGTSQLLNGLMDVRASDMVAAARLQAQLDRVRDGEGVEATVWQQAFMTFFELVRRHLSHDEWKAFVDEVYSSPDVRAVLGDQRSVASGEVTR